MDLDFIECLKTHIIILIFEEKIRVKKLFIKSNLKVKDLQRERNININNGLFNFIKHNTFEKNIELKYLSFCDTLVSKKYILKIIILKNI